MSRQLTSWLFGTYSWYAGGRFGRTYLVTPRSNGRCRVSQHARSGKCTRARDAESIPEGKQLAQQWELGLDLRG